MRIGRTRQVAEATRRLVIVAVGLLVIASIVFVTAPRAAAAVSVTIAYSATAVADADLDGNPATGSWGDAMSAVVPLENGAAGGYGSATFRAKHDGTYLYFRIDGQADVPWAGANANHFWLGMQISPTGTSHHGGGAWDGTFFGLWDGADYSPQPTYPPSPVDTNGFTRPPAKDAIQDDLGTLRYSGSAAPYPFTAEWKKKLSSGDASDIAYAADGTTAYNFFVTTDSNGGGSSGGAIDHNRVTNLNSMRFAAPPPPNHPPVLSNVGFSPDPAILGQDVTFTAAVSDADGDAVSYTWNFGDGSFATGQTGPGGGAIQAIHAYQQVGSYSAPLSVNDGKPDGQAQQSVQVSVVEPQAMSMTLTSNRREMMSSEIATIRAALVSGSTPVTGATLTPSTPLGGTFSPVRNLGTGNYEFDWTAPTVTRQTFAPINVLAKAPGYLDTSGRVVILLDPNRTNIPDPTQLFLLVRAPATSLRVGQTMTVTVYVYTIEGYVVSGALLTLLRVGPGTVSVVTDRLNGEYTFVYTAPASVPSPTGVLITITASKLGYLNGTARLAITVVP